MPEDSVGEPFCAVFQKISGCEKYYGQEGGGGINIFLRFFLSHSAEKFRRRIFLCCFRSFPLAKKFMDNRGGGDEEERSIKIFRRKFVLQCRKIS